MFALRTFGGASGFVNRCSRAIPVVIAAIAGACADLPTEPSEKHVPESRTLGVVEISLTGIGTPNMRASAAPSEPADGDARLDLTPVSEAGRSGIQLRALSSGTFTYGVRGAAGSYRYVFVTFEVRNASMGGVAYTTARKNLTFIGVATSATISGTAVKEILKFDGTPASTSDAQNWIPTGAAYLTIPQTISALSADVLQVFTETEAASFGVPAGVSAFPYGFMTRHATATDTRTLPANPAADVYDGFVTFAFKVPLPVAQSNDPYSVKLMVMAVDDSETRVTQSVEERDAPSQAAFEAKVTALSATGVTLLTGGSYSGTVTKRTLCGVRASGTAAVPIAYVNGAC
jgi:trimeric autotransporter adhesin